MFLKWNLAQGNDVTKNARQIRQIRSTLANAHSAIMSVYNECVVDEKPLPTSILSAIISIPSRYKKIRSNIEKMAPILYQSSDSITGMVMNQHTERMVKLCRQTMEQLEATYVASDQLNRGKYHRSRGSGHQRRQHYNY
jgi:uncharacterized protein YaaN involved in tellurite resistance